MSGSESHPQLTIRRAREEDLAAILTLLIEDQLGQHRETSGDPPAQCYRDAFAAIDADPHQFLALAEEASGAVIGMLQLTFIPGLARKGTLRGQIEAVRVAKAYRGQGLGQHLFEWAIAECRRRGCGLVQLTSDKSREEAHRFYERLGFRASHEGYKLLMEP